MKKLPLSLILVLFCATILQCHSKNLENTDIQTKSLQPIINGQPVESNHPLKKSIAGLIINIDFPTGPTWIQGCTATIFNDQWILTAAHCVDGFEADQIMIHFNINTVSFEKQLNPDTQIIDLPQYLNAVEIEGFVKHPKYDQTGDFDVALIKLKNRLTSDFQPVQLLSDDQLNLEKNETRFNNETIEVVLMGYGLINDSPSVESEVLRDARTQARFERSLLITNQKNGFGACNGDSGGPAFFKINNEYIQVGVTHGPNPPALTCKEEGQFVNPAFFKSFYNSVINIF